MEAELKTKAHKFMLDRGYGKGTNFTTSAVSSLMAEFALSLSEVAPKEEKEEKEGVYCQCITEKPDLMYGTYCTNCGYDIF